MRALLHTLLLAALLLAASCVDYRTQELPPWLREWPEAGETIGAVEGGALLLMFQVSGPYAASPHTYWWSWDNDPHPVRTKLSLRSPGLSPDGTFSAEETLLFHLSGFQQGTHVLHILLHNEHTGEDMMKAYRIAVAPPPEPKPVLQPEILGVVTTYNWTPDDDE